MEQAASERAILSFHEQLADDVEQGRRRTLADYLRLFPGHEEVIAREYLAVAEPITEANDAAANEWLFAGFELLGEIGRGGQAVVHRARDPESGREVALKILTGMGADSEAIAARLQREAALGSRVEHPAICTVLRSGCEDQVPWLAMELVEGTSLGRVIGERNTPPGEDELDGLLEMLAEVARALHAAHQSGIIHRDVKPANVMVTPSGRPVVLDFGLAAVSEGSLPTLTRTGDVMGTPSYMSPEQVRGATATIDHRSDVYSLGVVLYEALAGRRPFDAPTREALFHEILGAEAEDPRRLNSAISSELVRVIRCAMDPDPDRRYASAQDLAGDLEAVREQRPIRARSLPVSLRLRRWVVRRPVTATLIISLWVTAIAIAGVYRSRTRRLDAANLSLQHEKARVEETLVEVGRLSDQRILSELVEREARLWPAVPTLAEAMGSWIEDAEALVARLPRHEARLSELQRMALPYTEALRRAEWSEELREIEELKESERLARERRGQLKRALRIKQIDEILATTRQRIEALERRVSVRRYWTFPEGVTLAWECESLVRLVAELRSFAADGGLLEGVRARRKDALALERISLVDHREGWAQALREIAASPRYAGSEALDLTPQVGLVPLGADPHSGLQEFLHWPTHRGPVPTRDEKGQLRCNDETGMVLVLLPGGETKIGSSLRPGTPRFQKPAFPFEAPPARVRLDPFFVGKHEMTQAQFVNSGESNPSTIAFGSARGARDHATPRHPVETLTRPQALRALARCGLDLPTEAQWEYAARGGTDGSWYYGSRSQSDKHANLADRSFGKRHAKNAPRDESLEDGFDVHAPVGSFLPNPFGLHDVYGNVMEWCRDDVADYCVAPPRPGDGFTQTFNFKRAALRGGSWEERPEFARSAFRRGFLAHAQLPKVGCRAVRRVDP